MGRPGGMYWYVLQTHAAADVAYKRFLKDVRHTPAFAYKNESEKLVQLVGDRYVWFKSGENWQDMRGETLDGMVIDEYRQQHPDMWPMVLRSMLARRRGWAEFLSTPNGHEHFYDLFTMAQNDPTGEWAAFHAPSTEAWWWTPEEIASARATMSEAVFAQEIMAEFRDIAKGKAYICHGQHNWLYETPFITSDPDKLISDRLPIGIAMDFNLNPMAWTLLQTNGARAYAFDEVRLENSYTQEASLRLVEKLHEFRTKGLLRADPKIVVCGDATGKAGQRAAAGQSDYDIVLQSLKAAGFSFRNDTPESNPAIKDRVNTFNGRLRAANGTSTFHYHPTRCPFLKHDLERVLWKADGVLDAGVNKMLTHQSDGVGYYVHKFLPLETIKEVGTVRVIIR